VTTTTELTGAVIDWLVNACNQSPVLGVQNPQVLIFDGPTLSDTQLVAPQRVWIGADGYTTPGAEVEAATFSENFAFLDHARTRDDTIDVACACEYFDGDPTHQKIARDGALALMGAVELLLRGDPSTGGPGDASMGGLVFWSQVTGPGALIQSQKSAGVSALVRFRVSAFARLMT